MTSPSLNIQAHQTQTMNPRLQQAVRLLQMSSQDYEQELQAMAVSNPFLEVEAQLPTAAPFSTSDVTVLMPAAQPVVSDVASQPAHTEWDNAHTLALETTAADVELRQYLRSQANLLTLSERDHVLVCTVIESLDDDGYLRLGFEELGHMAGLSPAADACELQMALKLVQSLEPAGVGARDVSECLLLQIQNIKNGKDHLIRSIVLHHMDAVARRDVRGLSQRLQCPLPEVQAACDAIRLLDPRPGWRYGRSNVLFLKPDVVARKVQGTWTAQLNPAAMPSVKLNHSYATLFQRHRDSSKHAALGAELQEARWAIRNATQRVSTILAMAQAIVQRQRQYLDHGPLGMKPLALSDVAQAIGVHESTVCRASHNKYMAVAGRLIELKQFFCRALPMANNKAYSSTQIRALLQEMVATEDPLLPLSDVELAKSLARQGLSVARRTVTKYRQALNIPPAEHRRLA